MSFTTERLILRSYKVEDWKRVHIYGADAEFSKYELWGPNTLEDTNKFVNEMIQQVWTRGTRRLGREQEYREGLYHRNKFAE